MKSTGGSFSTNLEAFIIPNIIPAQPSLDIDVLRGVFQIIYKWLGIIIIWKK